MGDPMTALLMIHGLGATSGVWADVLEQLDWDGPVLTPDLPGHGSAEWIDEYTVGTLAAGVASSVFDQLEDDEPVIAVGHSLGGGVALCLASQFFGPVVTGVIGLGIKIAWTDDDVTNMAKVASRGRKPFDSRDEAVERFLRMAGLSGIVTPGHAAAEAAVVQSDGQWVVAQDPRTFAQRKLDMAGLMAAAKCPVILGAGANDAMVSEADIAAHVADPRICLESGHNVQVEDPAWVISLITELAGN